MAWHTTKVCGWGTNTHFFFLLEPSSRHMPHNTCAYRVINHASLVGRQIIPLTHLPILSFIIPVTNKAKPHVLLAYNITTCIFGFGIPAPKRKTPTINRIGSLTSHATSSSDTKFLFSTSVIIHFYPNPIAPNL